MDFRSAQPQVNHQAAPGGAPAGPRNKGWGKGNSQMLRAGAFAFLLCITILAVAIIGVIAVTKTDASDQSKLVTTSKYQAVFLTNGQVYFGNISESGKDFIRLQNIFYLTQNTTTDAKGNTTTDGNYTLVKLGCQQIHDPYDEMVIERSQVSFWENLQDGGKVVTSIKDFKKQNPKGPDCSQVSNQTQASNSSNTPQGSTTTTTPATTTGH